MIRRLVPQLSKRAQKDIAAVYRDGAREDPIAAKRLLDLIDDKFMSLATAGNKGVSRDWLSPGLRAFQFKNRCIVLPRSREHDASSSRIARASGSAARNV